MADSLVRGRAVSAAFSLLLWHLALSPATALANGSYTHIHISQLAIDGLPPGPLQTLLGDEVNRAWCEAASMFPDSGYAVGSHAYGEYTHWEPFFLRYIDWLQQTYGADFGSEEAQRHVAFLLGAMSHGLSDQVYDFTILERAFEIDGPEPADFSIDQYADYFIVVDQGVKLNPDPLAPYDILPGIINGDPDANTTSVEELMLGMSRMDTVIHFQGFLLHSRGYHIAWEHYPWLGTHIYNPAARGSLPWLGDLVADSWQVIWRRIHGEDDVDQDLVIRTIPEDGAEGFGVSVDDNGYYARMGLVLGYGVDGDDIRSLISVRAQGPDSEPVPLRIRSPYSDNATGRHRHFYFFDSVEPLEFDTEYTVELAAGVTTMSGATSTVPFMYSFRTRCETCPPTDTFETGTKPVRDGSGGGTADAGPTPDAGGGGAGGGGEGGGAGGGSKGGCAAAGSTDATGLASLALALGVLAARRRRAGKRAQASARNGT